MAAGGWRPAVTARISKGEAAGTMVIGIENSSQEKEGTSPVPSPCVWGILEEKISSLDRTATRVCPGMSLSDHKEVKGAFRAIKEVSRELRVCVLDS